MAIPAHTPILVTGATGLVGSYVCRRLLMAGYTQLYGQRREQSQLDMVANIADQIEWRTADLTDYFALEDMLEGMEVVIHCAAMVSFNPRDKRTLLQVNNEGTKYLVNAALHQQVRRLIHISSVAALGRHKDTTPTTEASKWENGPLISQYSLSKFLAETEVWRGQTEGLSVAALYPTIVLGAGRWWEGSLKIVDYATKARSYYPGGTTGVVDVRDVAEAVQLTLTRDEDGDRFLLNGANVSFQELLTQLASGFGVKPPSKLLPYGGARWLARLEKWRARLLGQSPLLTAESVANSYQLHSYDNSASLSKLGLSYRPFGQTIEEVVAAYKRSNGAEVSILT